MAGLATEPAMLKRGQSNIEGLYSRLSSKNGWNGFGGSRTGESDKFNLKNSGIEFYGSGSLDPECVTMISTKSLESMQIHNPGNKGGIEPGEFNCGNTPTRIQEIKS